MLRARHSKGSIAAPIQAVSEPVALKHRHHRDQAITMLLNHPISHCEKSLDRQPAEILHYTRL
jgi:hypothetical protein